MTGKQGVITLGLVSHHMEALPFIREQMERHGTIVMEEPPTPGFRRMLDGTLSIHDHLLEMDPEFPEFHRLMCSLLREFYAMGRRILQVEPYLESLMAIHEQLAEGQTVDHVMATDSLRPVYLAERAATGALIAYYAKSVTAPFPEVVQAVKILAMADARRLLLRDRLRASAIAAEASACERIFVEAGYIHFPLYQRLFHIIGGSWKVRVVFLMQPAVRQLNGKRRNLGPGDVLTLRYALNRRLPESQADLLAARSLITIKLIKTEELLPGASSAPHAEDEARVNAMVDLLSFEDCARLFHEVRLLKRDLALSTVQHYCAGKKTAL